MVRQLTTCHSFLGEKIMGEGRDKKTIRKVFFLVSPFSCFLIIILRQKTNDKLGFLILIKNI